MTSRFRNKTGLTALTAVMIGVASIASAQGTVAAADAQLPRGDFPACTTAITTYCITSVTFVERGVEKVGVWVPTGTAVNDANAVPTTKTFNTFSAVPYTGRWSYDGFPVATREHDGVYVSARPANEFTDSLMLSIEPAGIDSSVDKKVGRIKDAATNKVGTLDVNMGIKVVFRLGDLSPALTMVIGDNSKVTRTLDGTTPVVTFEGTPTPVALTTSSSKECEDETSVAAAKPHQLYMFTAFLNGRDSFGVAGMSGNMVISSNGPCKLSTPTWNATDKTLDFTAASPHFAPDGTTPNVGFYRATIPAADAKLLFGIDAAAVQSQSLLSASSVLTVEVIESTTGTSRTVSKNIAFKDSQFIVSVTGFTYSSPKIRMKTATPSSTTDSMTAPMTTAPPVASTETPTSTVATIVSTPMVAAPKNVKAKAARGIVKATFTKATGVSYSASAKKGKVTARFTCKSIKTTVTCTSKKLARGSWVMTVTPSKNGTKGTPARKTIKVS
jgi:hypothetical protein